MTTLYDKIAASGKPWTAQRAYKANCSDLRAFGRFEDTKEKRTAKIQAACAERAFWFSDPQTSSAGIAALRTLNGSMLSDMLELMQQVQPHLSSPEQRKQISELRRISYRRYFTSGKLPR